MHGAAVLGDYLYVFGGAKETLGWTDSTQVAPVYPDGSLGAWLETTPLPENRHYIANGTVTLNDVVYIAGGAVGESDTRIRCCGRARCPGGTWNPGGNQHPLRQKS
jgi:hypothetical protein